MRYCISQHRQAIDSQNSNPTWNALRAGIVAGLADHPHADQLTPADRQRIIARAEYAYNEVMDSPEFRAAVGPLPEDIRAQLREPMGRVLEVLIGEVVALATETVLLEKKLT